MALDLHPIGSSCAPSLCLCTGRNASGQVALPWVVAKRAPRRHRLRTPAFTSERGAECRSGSLSGRIVCGEEQDPQGRHDRLGTRRHVLGWPEARADPTSGTQRLVAYLVSTTPSGNVRVSTRLRFTQLSRAVKNGAPPPTRTGWVTIAYSSISPARMAAAASVAPPMSMGPPSSALSRVISVTASPVTRRVFQSTAPIVEENATFGMARQRRAGAICAGVAPGCWSAVGQWELIVFHSLRP